MNSCDFRVFLQEFGTTVHLSLPGSVSEKERLLLKLLMQGMSVTEISQYRNRSAKTISHQKKQLFEKLGIQSDITFWRDIFFQYNPEIISATGNNSHKYINDNHYHHIVTPEAISLALENHEFKPWIQPVFCAQTGVLNRPGFPGECFICELRLPDHRFRWKHNKLFLLLPEEYGPAFPAIVDCYTSPPT